MTSNQLDFGDGYEEQIRQAKHRRDVGMARADGAVPESWKDDVDEFTYNYLLTHPTLFTDHLQATDGFPKPPPKKGRSLGPRFQLWIKNRWMRRSTVKDAINGAVDNLELPSVHSNGRPAPVYISLIYRRP